MQNITTAINHLKKDPTLSVIIEKYGVIDYPPPKDLFASIAGSIVGQQLSGKAADTIWSRFIKLFPNESVTPENILNLDLDQIRSAGCSWAKARSLKDLSEKILNGTLQLDKLSEMANEEMIHHLIQVKGIGRWTAEMRLMFSFERPDVLPLDDRGIQNAFIKLYKLDDYSTEELKNTMQTIALPWQPFRTVACWYLWKYLDNR